MKRRGGFVTVAPMGLALPPVLTRGPKPSTATDDALVDLPPHREDGYLPPHLGERFVLRQGCSPYRITSLALVERYAISAGRRDFLTRLFRMRSDARALGVASGFTWVGGSFVDLRSEPNDLDVVTFFVPTPKLSREVVRAHPEIFRPTTAKETYGCDAYFLPLSGNRKSYRLVSLWYALFSHDRASLAWKGFVELAAGASDDAAVEALAQSR